MTETVLVRAFGGEPLRRILIEQHGLVAFVANPDSLDRIKSGESWPVGFPVEDVFKFEAVTYDRLVAAWKAGSTDGLWKDFALSSVKKPIH